MSYEYIVACRRDNNMSSIKTVTKKRNGCEPCSPSLPASGHPRRVSNHCDFILQLKNRPDLGESDVTLMDPESCPLTTLSFWLLVQSPIVLM